VFSQRTLCLCMHADSMKQRLLLYGCYLLQSVRSRRRTYIGFTVDPKRRLRQHNGDIKGGANKTKKWKPWKMVLCVWGFPGKVLALQFEYAWQHPNLSRHVKDKVQHLEYCKLAGHGKQCPVLGVERNVEVLLAMLRALPWRRMPLRVHFLDEGLWEDAPKMLRDLPNDLALTHGNFDELQRLCKQRETMVMPPGRSECATCLEQLKPGDLIVSCPHCQCLLHLCCAASVFAQEAKLMPDEPAPCPQCSMSLDWLLLLRNRRALKSAVAAEGEVDEEEDVVDDDSESERQLSEVQFASQGDAETTDVELSQELASQDLPSQQSSCGSPVSCTMTPRKPKARENLSKQGLLDASPAIAPSTQGSSPSGRKSKEKLAFDPSPRPKKKSRIGGNAARSAIATSNTDVKEAESHDRDDRDDAATLQAGTLRERLARRLGQQSLAGLSLQ